MANVGTSSSVHQNVPRGAPRTESEYAQELRDIFRELTTHRGQLDELDHYQVLGVEDSASHAEIQTAYFDMAKLLHPDYRVAHNVQIEGVDARALDAVYHRVQSAYEVVGNKNERQRYDSQRPGRAPARTAASVDSPSRTAAADSQPKRRYTPEELASIHFLRGRAYLEAQENHDAVEALRQAVRLDPSKAEHHFFLARGLSRNPKWRKHAEEHFRKALDLDPVDVKIYLGLGELYEESGLPSRARRMYEDALELAPDNAAASKRLSAIAQVLEGVGASGGIRSIFSSRRGG